MRDTFVLSGPPRAERTLRNGQLKLSLTSLTPIAQSPHSHSRRLLHYGTVTSKKNHDGDVNGVAFVLGLSDVRVQGRLPSNQFGLELSVLHLKSK